MPNSTLIVAPADVLDACEARLLDAAVRLAPRMGWSERLLDAIATDTGVSRGEIDLLWPAGVRDLSRAFAERHDAAALRTLARTDAAALGMRERITAAVQAWLDAAVADEIAMPRFIGSLALPTHAALALRLTWRSADRLWRWAGDTATDENHYSKRALLAEILVSTLAVRLTRGPGAARTHLERRIAGVGAFETLKARAPRPMAMLEQAAATLGRLRYGRPLARGD